MVPSFAFVSVPVSQKVPCCKKKKPKVKVVLNNWNPFAKLSHVDLFSGTALMSSSSLHWFRSTHFHQVIFLLMVTPLVWYLESLRTPPPLPFFAISTIS